MTDQLKIQTLPHCLYCRSIKFYKLVVLVSAKKLLLLFWNMVALHGSDTSLTTCSTSLPVLQQTAAWHIQYYCTTSLFDRPSKACRVVCSYSRRETPKPARRTCLHTPVARQSRAVARPGVSHTDASCPVAITIDEVRSPIPVICYGEVRFAAVTETHFPDPHKWANEGEKRDFAYMQWYKLWT